MSLELLLRGTYRAIASEAEGGPYRLRVWITHAHTTQPEAMTNPARYPTREDAARVARAMPIIGIAVGSDTVIPGNRIYRIDVVDTREESEAP